MINPQCSKCKNRLDDYGAILFSPPLSIIKDGRCDVNKIHLCSTCYDEVFNFIMEKKE